MSSAFSSVIAYFLFALHLLVSADSPDLLKQSVHAESKFKANVFNINSTLAYIRAYGEHKEIELKNEDTRKVLDVFENTGKFLGHLTQQHKYHGDDTLMWRMLDMHSCLCEQLEELMTETCKLPMHAPTKSGMQAMLQVLLDYEKDAIIEKIKLSESSGTEVAKIVSRFDAFDPVKRPCFWRRIRRFNLREIFPMVLACNNETLNMSLWLTLVGQGRLIYDHVSHMPVSKSFKLGNYNPGGNIILKHISTMPDTIFQMYYRFPNNTKLYPAGFNKARSHTYLIVQTYTDDTPISIKVIKTKIDEDGYEEYVIILMGQIPRGPKVHVPLYVPEAAVGGGRETAIRYDKTSGFSASDYNEDINYFVWYGDIKKEK
jgi:hypothetical protein